MHRHLREHNNVRARSAKRLNNGGRATAELAGSRVVPMSAVGLKELDVYVIWKLGSCAGA